MEIPQQVITQTMIPKCMTPYHPSIPNHCQGDEWGLIAPAGHWWLERWLESQLGPETTMQATWSATHFCNQVRELRGTAAPPCVRMVVPSLHWGTTSPGQHSRIWDAPLGLLRHTATSCQKDRRLVALCYCRLENDLINGGIQTWTR